MTNTMRFRYSIILISVILTLSGQAQAVRSVSGWSNLYPGIDHATGEADFSEPRIQKVNCLRIDLNNPYIRILTTPDNGDDPLETNGVKTSKFLTDSNLKVAVNGGSFSPWDPYSNPEEPKDVRGYQVSNGTLVSAEDQDIDAIVFRANNDAEIMHHADIPTNGLSYAHNAITGWRTDTTDGILLEDGTITVPTGGDAHPRTAVGLSQDGRYFYMMTIDGRQTYDLIWSDGATNYDTADWLVRFGAYDGMNMDGGGSTTMVKSDGSGGYDTINVPVGEVVSEIFPLPITGSERVVGSHIGVYIVPEPGSILTLVGGWVLLFCRGFRILRIPTILPYSGPCK